VFNFSQFFHRAGHWFPPCLMTTVQLYQAGLAVVAPWNLYHAMPVPPTKLPALVTPAALPTKGRAPGRSPPWSGIMEPTVLDTQQRADVCPENRR
jgi:hypothetical protein